MEAERSDSFWLWAGVQPPDWLGKARSIYILDSEIRGSSATFVPLRPASPHVEGPELWLVVRTDTLAWPDNATLVLASRLDRWAAQGDRVAGLQVDFDAHTRHLSNYADFLRKVRRKLPSRYKLSITGLMDWSANSDPTALLALKATVDEVIIQTYQGRHTIPGYGRYFDRMRRFPIPFKVGLVERGRWSEPAGLSTESNFRGYVVFLLPKT